MIGHHRISKKIARPAKRWWDRLAKKLQLAILWPIPVGFEDEAGFHLGEQPVGEPMDWERADLFAGEEHF